MSGACPQRTCVGCRVRAAKADLLRVVVVGDACVPDPRGRMPGRGASLHLDPACLDLAERRRAFLRAFRSAGPLDTGALRRYVAEVTGAVQEEQGKQRPQPQGAGGGANESKAGREADERSMSTQR